MKIDDIFNDNRFFIDDFTRQRLFYKTNNIYKNYQFLSFSINKIYMEMETDLLRIEETIPFKYLNNEINTKDLYQKYCTTYGTNNPNRTETSYSELINNLHDQFYSPKKGVIIINQYGILLDGQHRCCILKKMYGEGMIDVLLLKIKYPLKRKIQILIKFMKMRFRNA